MKKRLLSYLVSLVMLVLSFGVTLPAYAKSDFCIFEDFNDYVGTWNGTTVTDTATFPSVDVGSMGASGTITKVSGVTSGTAADAKYGTSVKVYSDYDETISTTIAASYKLSKTDYLKNSSYLETSVYIEKPEDGSKLPRSIRVHGINDAYNSSRQIYAVLFNSTGKIHLMDVETDVMWEFDKWYDMKAWMNIDSGEYEVQLLSDGVMVVEASGVSETLAGFGEIRTILFLHNAKTDHSTYMKDKDPVVTYFDNLKVESIEKFHVDEVDTSKHAILDFETIDMTSQATIKSYCPLGTLSYGKGTPAVNMDLELVETDRGNSLRMKPWVLSRDEYDWSLSTITKEDGTVQKTGDVYDKAGNLIYDRNTMLYPSVCFDLSKANYIYDGAYFKTSVMFEDANFGAFTIKITNNFTAFSTAPNGNIAVFGKDSGIKFAIGKWYDIEGAIDVDTGYYTVSLAREDNSVVYKDAGFVSVVDLTSNGQYTGIYRLVVNLTNRVPANDWSVPTSVLLDDMQIGSVEKLKAPISRKYFFEKVDDPTAFVVNGGTSAVENESLKVTGVADAETSVAMALPFVNTNFNYSADITIDDLTSERKLVAQNQTAYTNKQRVITPVEMVKFGADGKLYVGGTLVEGVNVSAGTYSVSGVFNQSNHIAKMTVSKADEVIATEEVSLEDVTKILSLDWSMGAAEAVTAFDNISYNTVYDFELIEDMSTNGEVVAADDVIVKFTNPVDKSSFSADKVKVNGGTVRVDGFEFIDDYTVKVNFEKSQGTYYMVEFTEIADICGNTLTDYIEFDTIKQDLELSTFAYKKGDKVLSLVESGEITASFTAKGNNGCEYNILGVVCLYQGGKIVKIVHDVFEVGKEKREHSLKVTIPDDGKLYIIKGYLWDADTLEPYRDPEMLTPIVTDQPIALVKLDDLTTNADSLAKFGTALEFAEENNIKMSFGLIGIYLDLGSEAGINKVLEFYNHPLVEIWDHAYTGKILGTATDEFQAEDFAKGQAAAAKYGIKYSTFCAPSSNINAYTGVMLNKYNYKVLMTYDWAELEEWGLLDESNSFITLHPKKFNIEPEKTSLTRDLDEMKAMWVDACKRDEEFVIVQVHPNGWDGHEGSEKRFFDFLSWLKARGVVFMTFEEYADYISVVK